MTGTAPRGLRQLLQRNSRKLGAAQTLSTLYNLGDYPAATPNQNSSRTLFGKVIALRNPTQRLPALDRYEEYWPGRPEISTVVRTPVPVTLTPSGNHVEACVYWCAGSTRFKPLIQHERYDKFLPQCA